MMCHGNKSLNHPSHKTSFKLKFYFLVLYLMPTIDVRHIKENTVSVINTKMVTLSLFYDHAHPASCTF